MAERGTRDRNRPPDRTSSSSRASVSLTLRCPRDAWARSHSKFSGDRVTEIGLFIGQLYDIYMSSHQTGCSPNGLNRLTPPKTKFVPLFLLFRSRTEEKQSHSSWRYRRMANGSRTYPTSRERARFTSAHSPSRAASPVLLFEATPRGRLGINLSGSGGIMAHYRSGPLRRCLLLEPPHPLSGRVEGSQTPPGRQGHSKRALNDRAASLQAISP